MVLDYMDSSPPPPNLVEWSDVESDVESDAESLDLVACNADFISL